jgi:hypothetical protein
MGQHAFNMVGIHQLWPVEIWLNSLKLLDRTERNWAELIKSVCTINIVTSNRNLDVASGILVSHSADRSRSVYSESLSQGIANKNRPREQQIDKESVTDSSRHTDVQIERQTTRERPRLPQFTQFSSQLAKHKIIGNFNSSRLTHWQWPRERLSDRVTDTAVSHPWQQRLSL